MIKIFKTNIKTRCTIEVLRHDSNLGAISSYLSKSVADYFLSFLSAENRQQLDEKGHLTTHREQFAWLPEDNLPWSADGLPSHERKNLSEWVSKTNHKS